MEPSCFGCEHYVIEGCGDECCSWHYCEHPSLGDDRRELYNINPDWCPLRKEN